MNWMFFFEGRGEATLRLLSGISLGLVVWSLAAPALAETAEQVEAPGKVMTADLATDTDAANSEGELTTAAVDSASEPVDVSNVVAELAVAESEEAEGAAEAPVKRRPQAKSVPLDEPVIVAPIETIPVIVEEPPEEPVVEDAETVAGQLPADQADDQPSDSPDPDKPEEDTVKPLVILDTEVPPSTSTRLAWSPSQSLEGIATPTPVLIVNGAEKGPVLCLTAAVHGDELNGIEIVRRVLYNLDPEKLSGTVVGVPIVNLQGFLRSSRYLTDRRDLNRFFPGNPTGSSASRIAYSFFNEVIRHCDALVDLHTGSYHRTNMPQLRGDLRDPQVVQLTQGFGATVVMQSEGASGTLRRAAVDAGIPAVTLEAGESMRLQEDSVEHGVNGITTLMSKMGMVERFSFWGDPEPAYYSSIWVRADKGGILFSNVSLGESVDQGDLLGEVTDPITNIKKGIVSPHRGRVIGMALNQVVLPGFAAFHIAIEATREKLKEKAKPITAAETPVPVPTPAVPSSAPEPAAKIDPAPDERPSPQTAVEPEESESSLQSDPDMIDVEVEGSDMPDTDDFD